MTAQHREVNITSTSKARRVAHADQTGRNDGQQGDRAGQPEVRHRPYSAVS